MILELNTSWLYQTVHFFKSREEYDAHDYSKEGYKRWLLSSWNKPKPYEGPPHCFKEEPTKFPCILIEASLGDPRNGPYEIECIILEGKALKIIEED